MQPNLCYKKRAHVLSLHPRSHVRAAARATPPRGTKGSILLSRARRLLPGRGPHGGASGLRAALKKHKVRPGGTPCPRCTRFINADGLIEFAGVCGEVHHLRVVMAAPGAEPALQTDAELHDCTLYADHLTEADRAAARQEMQRGKIVDGACSANCFIVEPRCAGGWQGVHHACCNPADCVITPPPCPTPPAGWASSARTR